MRRRGFTLTELLIVIAVIAALAAMLIVVIPMIQRTMKIGKTRTIMDIALAGLAETSMKSEINASVVEHPLANSAPPRSPFLRALAVPGRFAAGAPVATSGEALRIVDGAQPTIVAASEAARLLLPSDRYQGAPSSIGTDCPMLFGMERWRLTILGSGFGLHAVRRLPEPSPKFDRDGDAVLDGAPYGPPLYLQLDAAPGNLASPTLLELDQQKLLTIALGSAATELTNLGAIRSGDAQGGAAVGSTLICGNRLRSWGAASSAWRASLARNDSAVMDAGGAWMPYRLRGPALADAWGHEILCWRAANGALTLESAGPDGYFRWNPGPDGIYQTSATADAPAGDDLDGQADNIPRSR